MPHERELWAAKRARITRRSVAAEEFPNQEMLRPLRVANNRIGHRVWRTHWPGR